MQTRLRNSYWALRRFARKLLVTPARRRYVRRLGIPVIAVTGTNGKTTTTRFLELILREAGYRTGMCCTEGVMRHGRWTKSKRDHAGPLGVHLATTGGDIDVLIAETARGGIIRDGFGFHTCDVAVVTNVADDHLGIDGVHTLDEMARVKARLLDQLKPNGMAVLNADDPRVAAIGSKVRGPVIWFSMQRPSPELSRCLYVHQGWIWRRESGVDTQVMATGDLASARDGLLPYNLANAMAALGVLDGLRAKLPVSDELASRVLATAGMESDGRPFAFHLVDYRGAHVLFLQSKNPETYRLDMAALARLRSSLGYERVVGIISNVGNRSAEFHRSIAASAAEACDYLLVVPPHEQYLRGRSKSSLVAALEVGIPRDKRLPSRDGDCREIIAALRPGFPETTLYVILMAGCQRGAKAIVDGDRPAAVHQP